MLQSPVRRSAGALSALLPLLLSVSPADAQTAKIAGGTVIEECGFGPQVITTEGICSGLLIHPQVILNAGHCPYFDGQMVNFTHLNPDIAFYEPESYPVAPGQAVEIDYCKQWETDSHQHDIGFCVLKTPVVDIPIIPPAWGCELDEYFQVDEEVTIIGFGDTEGSYDYTKRVASSFITSDPNNPEYFGFKVGPNNGQSACNGDSGGPLLKQLSDGTWRVLGNLSSRNGTCGDNDNSNNYASIKDAVPWIEEQSGIDVTPCHDIDGTWNPTENCGGFYNADRDAQTYGTWDNWCSGTPRSGASATCGDSFDGEIAGPPPSGGNGTGGDTGAGTGGDSGVPGAAGGGDGLGGEGSGLPGTGGMGANSQQPTTLGTDEGCSCRAAGSSGTPRPLLTLLALLGLAGVLKLRRRPTFHS